MERRNISTGTHWEGDPQDALRDTDDQNDGDQGEKYAFAGHYCLRAPIHLTRWFDREKLLAPLPVAA